MSTSSGGNDDEPLEESPIFDVPNLAIIPIFTATLSVLGSYVVIRESWQQKPSQTSMRAPLVRALMAMSLSDLLQAVALGFSTVPTPHWVTHVPFAIGNYTTCEVQGLFAQMGNVATPLFSTLLIFYYLLILKHNWSDNRIKQTEPWAHGSIWLVAIVCSGFPVPLNLYNNAYHVCWINGYPEGCDYIHPDIPCERGGDYVLWGTVFTIFPLWPCLIAVLVMMCMIHSKVRTIEERSALYGASQVLEESNDDDMMAEDSSAFYEQQQERHPQERQPQDDSENHNQHPTDSPPQHSSQNIQQSTTSTNRNNTTSEVLPRTHSGLFLRSSGDGSVELPEINRSRSRAVSKQAFLFVMAFIMTHIFRLIATLWWTMSEGGDEIWLYVIAYDVMICLQGFFNALVLLRTRKKLHTPEGQFFQKLICCNLVVIPQAIRRHWSSSVGPNESIAENETQTKQSDEKPPLTGKTIDGENIRKERGRHSSLPSGGAAIHSSVQSSAEPSIVSRGDRFGFFANDSLGHEYDLSLTTSMESEMRRHCGASETEQSLGVGGDTVNEAPHQRKRSTSRKSQRRSSRKNRDKYPMDVAEDDEFRHQPSEIIIEEESDGTGETQPRQRPPPSDVTLDKAFSSTAASLSQSIGRDTVNE